MKIVFTLVLSLCALLSFAQFEITGNVSNTTGEPLVGSTVVLLDSDSTMVAFGLTNSDGFFSLTEIEENQYILQVTFISYASYSKALDVDWSNKNIDLGAIILEESSEILQEITINAEHIPMGIKGDTISYNASAFKTRPNATVEDLLKKLPGIEVERNGNIKAQGEDVENVLVDGKEFFGSDPQMATKNLEAEAVDKVEVYDKKSEIAEFTGIDDGDEEKTINLKLKEDHKKGGFGNVNMAGGTEDTYQGKMNYFRFSPVLQASMILASNNINQETFTISDRIDFMGGIANAMAGGSLNLSNYEEMGDGLNNSLSAGINLGYDISKKLDIRTHYVLNRNTNYLNQSSDFQSFTDSFDYSSNSTTEENERVNNHQLNTKLRYKANPLTEFMFRNNARVNDRLSDRTSNSNYQLNNADGGFANSVFNSSNYLFGFDSYTLFKRKFEKKGRNLIASFTFKTDDNNSEDQVFNTNRIVENSFDLNQDQIYDNTKNQISSSINYTEPINTKYYLGGEYKYGYSNERPYRDYFDIVDNGKVLNTDLSANFLKRYVYNIGGLSLRRNTKKVKMVGALKIQQTLLEGIINDGQESISGTYLNFLPSYNLDMEFKGGKSMSFDYTTSIQAPELEQMLPLPNNTFANYEYIGNPTLTPEYNHALNLHFNYYDNFSFTSFWARANVVLANNRIVTKTDIDENLFRTIQPINTDDYFSASAYMNFSKPFKPLKINYRIRTRLRYANYESFINDKLGKVEDSNLNLRLSINNRKKEIVDIETGISLDIYDKKYGINPDFNQRYNNLDYFVDGELYLPKGWTLGTKLNLRRYSEESFSDNPSYYLWSADLSKLFLEDKLEITLTAFDILNQNIGYRRQSSNNSLSQVYYNNLSRFFMLGVHYRIGKTRSDGIRIEMD